MTSDVRVAARQFAATAVHRAWLSPTTHAAESATAAASHTQHQHHHQQVPFSPTTYNTHLTGSALDSPQRHSQSCPADCGLRPLPTASEQRPRSTSLPRTCHPPWHRAEVLSPTDTSETFLFQNRRTKRSQSCRTPTSASARTILAYQSCRPKSALCAELQSISMIMRGRRMLLITP